MDNTVSETMKAIIMRELFVDVNNQKCVIDLFLREPKKYKEREGKIGDASIVFLNENMQRLLDVYDKGMILFFRKYNYENILDEYLAEKFGKKSVDILTAPVIKEKQSAPKLAKKEKSGRKQQELLETQRLEQERKQKERETKEKYILANIESFSWKKIPGIGSVVYESYFSGNKKIEVYVKLSVKKENPSIACVLKYDQKAFQYVAYDGEEVKERIEKTHPITVRNEHLQVRFSTKPIVDPKIEEKKKKEAKRRRELLEEQNRIKEEKKRLHQELLRAQQEEKQKRLLEHQEKSRRLEEERQERYSQLPQIGVKDFVVRRAVFKCMHSKHDVVDLDAAIKIIGKDDKARLVKISAGYCKQCRVYFIMESTYQSLKNMGDVILCRICDEKTYMKNSYVNGMRLAQESILMQFGYNVSQEEGLSATRRQKILAVMIDNKVISKSEIISYLDFFINQRKYQSKFEIAVSKWEEDRDFVQGYRVGQYTQYGVNAIYRR